MKRNLLLTVAIFFSAVTAFAQIDSTQKCGDNIYWSFAGGTLTITGTGATYGYYESNILPPYTFPAPWKDYRDAITNVWISPGITSLGCNLLAYLPNLSSIYIPETVTSIGGGAMGISCQGVFASDTSLVSINIPRSITEISAYTFTNCGFTSLSFIPSHVTRIGYRAFSGNRFVSITIPNHITQIDEGAFNYCRNLTSVTLSNSMPAPGLYAYNYCENLTSIIIPSSITYLSSAFMFCPNISSVECNVKTPPGNPNFDNAVPSTCIIKVPASAVEQYLEDSRWNKYTIQSGGYSLAIRSHDNSRGFANGDGLYDGEKKSTATVEAVAHKGYHFVNWTKDGVVISTSNPYSFTVTEDIVLIANFEEGERYLVSVSANDEAFGTATGGGNYDENATATVTATAYTGYKFVNWTKNDEIVSTLNPYSFIVTEDTELVANFEEAVGITDIKLSNLKIFPNPTTGELKIDNEEMRIDNVEVYDMMGRLLQSKIVNLQSEIVIDISHLSIGVYFLRISTEAGEVVRKVLKE